MPRFLTSKQYDEHYKLYRGYVDKVDTLLKNPQSTREWSRDFNYAYSGARLHQLYFEHINATPKENTEMLTVIKQSFGSVDSWAKSLSDLAKTCRPAGWALTCYNKYNNSLCNIAFDSHDHLIPDMEPLIILDMFEHAYIIQFGIDKDTYIRKFIETMNWDIVWNRLQTVLVN